MKVSLLQQIKLTGLTLAIAAFSYQPSTQASFAPTFVSANAAVTLAQTPSAAKSAIKQATFVGDNRHETAGAAKIVEENGQRYLEFDAAFRSDSGPDLFVLLHKEAVPSTYSADNYVNLGRIQELDGAQRYAIPADVDIADLKSAVIWCQQFDVTFGYATF